MHLWIIQVFHNLTIRIYIYGPTNSYKWNEISPITQVIYTHISAYMYLYIYTYRIMNPFISASWAITVVSYSNLYWFHFTIKWAKYFTQSHWSFTELADYCQSWHISCRLTRGKQMPNWLAVIHNLCIKRYIWKKWLCISMLHIYIYV